MVTEARSIDKLVTALGEIWSMCELARGKMAG
jgi:hypothetical protein